MPENRTPVRVAVNVMRARLTVIGFNIAIVSFQINQLYWLSGGVTVPGMERTVHVGADIALFMALALSVLAMVAFIMSSTFDEVGYCTHWTLVAGDLLMYLGLAHTISGFFQPWSSSIATFYPKLPDQVAGLQIIHIAVLAAGGVAWFLATYVGPVVSLARSPFNRRTNSSLGIAYLVMLLVLCGISGQSHEVETLSVGKDPSLALTVIKELAQPFRW